jgi:hypothetical protein
MSLQDRPNNVIVNGRDQDTTDDPDARTIASFRRFLRDARIKGYTGKAAALLDMARGGVTQMKFSMEWIDR